MMKETETTLGRRLTELRQGAGLSQQALADRLSVTRQAVSNWERDQTSPDLDTLGDLAEILGTDLNTLGGRGPAAKHRRGGIIAGTLAALGLCAVLALAALPSGPAPAEAAPLDPHRVRYVTPNGVTVTAADARAETAALLSTLPEEGPGPVAVTAELADTLCYLAGQYELRFAPECSDGAILDDWDQVLFWLYKAGISGGGVMTEAQVETALADLLGQAGPWEHRSTEHFALGEEGYRPEDAATARGGAYCLTSLERLEDGGFAAVLQEADGTGITLTLALAGETVQFRGVARSEQGAEL